MTKKITIILVDDHKLILEGVRLFLEKDGSFDIQKEFNNAEEVIPFITTTTIQIDVALVDINLSDISGIELTKLLKESYPDIKVIILTAYNNKEIINEVIASEADGYILKSASKEELISAIKHVVNYGAYYDKSILQLLNESHFINKKVTSDKNLLELLSVRELEVLKLICQEYSTTEIAEKLFITTHTVDSHRKSIVKKTEVKNLVSLIKLAILHKLV